MKESLTRLYCFHVSFHADKDGNILAGGGSDAQPPTRKNVSAPTTTATRPVTAKPPSPKKKAVANKVNAKLKRKDQDTGGDESSQVCCHLQHLCMSTFTLTTLDFVRGEGEGP